MPGFSRLLVVAIAVILAAGCERAAVAQSADLYGSNVGELSSSVSGLRTRTAIDPRSTSYEIKRMRREADRLRNVRPNDPRIGHIKGELLDEQRRADRIDSRQILRSGMGRHEPPSRRHSTFAGSGSVPSHFDNSLRTPVMPIGTGKSFIFIQRGLRAANDSLAAGDLTRARRHYDAAASEFDRLMSTGGAIIAEDPNAVALQRQIGSLKGTFDLEG